MIRMGNVQSWGGPLTKSWREGQAELQKKIVQVRCHCHSAGSSCLFTD
jgi:hypothetical protein